MENQTSEVVNPAFLQKITRKQKERKEAFFKLRKEHILDETATSILKLPVEELVTQLQTRQLSACHVLRAYTAKALEVTEKFNCVTEFIPQATKWATSLDSMSHDTKLPLHGLPVAIKDDHDVEGLDSTLGFAKNLYKPAAESAVLIKTLIKLGAVPFLKTNVPQSLLSNGEDNPIFGTTLNSWNTKLAPGGSSSGSASIVAAGGAPFATGSDFGGSLRVPSHFHGLCTVRPTINRLSGKGIVQCLPQCVGCSGVPGIIARDVKTLSLVWKSLTENCLQNQYDPIAMPIPWNNNLFASTDKLHIGYFTSFPFFPAFEDTQKTILAAKAALELKGHTLLQFEMFDEMDCMRLFNDVAMSDQGKHLKELFEGEPVSYCVSNFVSSIRNMGNKTGVEDPTQHLPEKLKIMASFGANVKTAGDLSKLLNERKAIILDMLARMEKTGVDLLISPVYPFPTVKLEFGHAAMPGFVYSCIWNFLDFPAGVVRFGTESGRNIDSYDDQNDPMFKMTKEALSESAGSPISVQVISKPYKEELALRVMLELESAYKPE